MKNNIKQTVLLLQEKAESSKGLVEKMYNYQLIYDIVRGQIEAEIHKQWIKESSSTNVVLLLTNGK